MKNYKDNRLKYDTLVNRFQVDNQTYELFKVVDGNYLNVPMEFLFKD